MRSRDELGMGCAALSFPTDEAVTPRGLQPVHPKGCINGDGVAIYLLVLLFVWVFLVNFAAFDK